MKELAIRSADVPRPDGRIPDGRIPDGRIPDGRIPDGRIPDGRIPDSWPDATAYELLARGLAVASRSAGITQIALEAPIAPAAGLVAAWGPAPAVAWTSGAEVLVGVGVARELRGHGEPRWRELVEAGRALELGDRIGDCPAAPRFVGGLAFAPGSADREPWAAFGDAWFALPRWTYAHDGARARLVLAVDARDAGDAARWRSELATVGRGLGAGWQPAPQPAACTLDRGDPQVWRAQIRAITDAIARGECAKIVAARSTVAVLSGTVRPADLLAELDVRHPDCVRLLVRPPGGGTLVAATPERLVRRAGAEVACDALAGSLARAPGAVDPAAAALLASDKDRREHALVVDAIADALRGLDADPVVPAAPVVRALRHVLHLHTPITATLRSSRHVLELAARLHPTPAVGGTPTAFAAAWIGAREAEPRGWYAAPVGWFEPGGDGELAVALRGGVLAGERAYLWAGAGIVAGSDPDRELAETELKLRAMLGALGVQA